MLPQCGKSLADVDNDVCTNGFFYGSAGELLCGENDWDELRALIQRAQTVQEVKDEPVYSDLPSYEPNIVDNTLRGEHEVLFSL